MELPNFDVALPLSGAGDFQVQAFGIKGEELQSAPFDSAPTGDSSSEEFPSEHNSPMSNRASLSSAEDSSTGRTSLQPAALPNSSVLPAPPTVPACKQACVACRKLKASCSGMRPCARCVKAGRECVDRSADEVEAAKERRKRYRHRVEEQKAKSLAAAAVPALLQQHATLAHTSSLLDAVPWLNTWSEGQRGAKSRSSASATATPVSPGTATASSTESPATRVRASAPTYTSDSPAHFSKSLLAAYVNAKLRDMILRVDHAIAADRRATAKYGIPWRLQLAMFIVYLSDMLLPSDFDKFLTDGLTEQQMQSSVFARSLLHTWMKPATRPFYYAWCNETNGSQKDCYVGDFENVMKLTPRPAHAPKKNKEFAQMKIEVRRKP
jgi:hypothetical protein